MSESTQVIPPARRAVHAAAEGPALDHDGYFDIATRRLPGAGLGANALPEDVRFIVRKAEGSRIEDVRGRTYIDYVCGAGALILGNAHPAVMEAIAAQLPNGIHYFAMLNEPAIRLTDEIAGAVPCAEKVIFTTTGSEATFYAMRLARAFTGRDKILKFEGGYHGNHDYSNFSVFPTAVSNYPAGRLDSSGIPSALSPTVLVAPYNDLDTVRRIVEENRDDLAGIMAEPLQRIIVPEPDFLSGLRQICDDNGVLLMFDEVVTGFRLDYGGAQAHFGVTPDLASLGKIVGGGGALGAVTGRAEIIDLASPYKKGENDYAMVNGTLHGSPMACVAGLATLAELRQPGVYEALAKTGDDLRKACQKVFNRLNVPALAVGEASFWQILFLNKPPRNYADVMNSDMKRSKELDLELIRQGLYVLPNTRRFVSTVHTQQDLEDTVRALDAACRELGYR